MIYFLSLSLKELIKKEQVSEGKNLKDSSPIVSTFSMSLITN